MCIPFCPTNCNSGIISLGNNYKCKKGFVHKDVHYIVVYGSKRTMSKIFLEYIAGRKIMVQNQVKKARKKIFIFSAISELLIFVRIKGLKDTDQNMNSCCFKLVVL